MSLIGVNFTSYIQGIFHCHFSGNFTPPTAELHYKKKRVVTKLLSFYWNRRRPTLPGRVQPSTISAEGLNFCVRNENRWIPTAIVTGMVECLSLHTHNCTVLSLSKYSKKLNITYSSVFWIRLRISLRPISIGKLNTLLCLHTRPIYLVVFKGSYQ